MLLVVDDAEATVERAEAVGAVVVCPVFEQHGRVLGRIETRSAITGRPESR